VLLLSLTLAAAYLGWQLCGLRYTTHDDIFFNLQSWIFSDSTLSFASHVAARQGRLQAYINMPIILGVDGLAGSGLYDVLNIGSILAVYVSLIYFLSTAGPARDAIALVTVALLLFPLHYYPSFPQGYPVMACWGFCLALLAGGLLGAYYRDPSQRTLAASLVLFVCSLWGPEYNFVLHPVLLAVPALNAQIERRRLFLSSMPYLLGWLLCLIPYLMYSAVSHAAGADAAGRVVPGLDFGAWIKAIAILEEKAFLPVSLVRGILFTAATGQGVPRIPSPLTFETLFRGIPDVGSFVVVFLAASALCGISLYWQALSARVVARYALVFAGIALVPSAVLAASSHYQKIVLAGELQGHLVTHYAQLGMAGVLFLMLSTLCNRWPDWPRRGIAVFVSGLALAAGVSVTFLYNNVNRQVMSANMQKWEAVHTLGDFVHLERPDLERRSFQAPAFWTYSGASAIPADALFSDGNYWTEYAKSVLKVPMAFRGAADEERPEAVFVTYFATPAGTPAVVFYERQADAENCTVSLVARRPVAGVLSYHFMDGSSVSHPADHWSCKDVCSMQWHPDHPIQSATIHFQPSESGPTRLLAQFGLTRGGRYGMPLRSFTQDGADVAPPVGR
jgi:hypothetical protein